jgi:acetyl-CoA carboxylase carboxyl transferase alpha subunit/acetyl-CoA carboxylase carboxyl transferase beta subunit
MSILKGMFKKTTYIPLGGKEEEKSKAEVPSVPEGLFIKCSHCGKTLYKEDVVNNVYVCPKCKGYFRIKANTRLKIVLDKASFEEWDTGLCNQNPLDYPGYDEKIKDLKERTRLDEAVKIGKGTIDGNEVVIGVCDSRFLMGSMGYVLGEKITRGIEKATELCLPVILFCCSGGARMQEGIVSLMQMAKTSAAIKRHSDAGLLYIPVLTDPTTGGVTASFAMLGDIILAEPGALIGFAGPRVIQQTIGQKLPEGFQRAEFLVEHGIIDGIVKRENLKKTLSSLVNLHKKTEKYADFKEASPTCELSIEELKQLKLEGTTQDVHKAWDRVQIARSAKRPSSLQYIDAIFTDFMELHGDRTFRDDGAIVGGLAFMDGQPVTVIGVQKGKNTKENITRNFGMPSPEGYRKALRLMKEAEKFNRPIITFVDTPGAFCGIEAEERGQGEAIARNLMEMAGLKTPVLSIVIGEGGSGGALALAVGNEVWMMENSTYSILSPEGFASILWKDSKRAEEAAEIMKVTASDLKNLNIIDRVIPEGECACNENLSLISNYMKKYIKLFLEEQELKSMEEIVQQRYERFRRM